LGVWYTTREAVTGALDIERASYRAAQIDGAIEMASRSVDQLINRHRHGLAPRVATRYFSYPSRNYAPAYRLWLDENELISLSALSAGGTTISSSDYFLEPVNSGPPYTHIEIDLASSAAFQSGSTSQRAIEATGTWGYSDDSAPAGTLAEALDASETAVDVTDSSLIGVGDVILVDSERMIVTDKTTLDTGQNLATDMSVSKADQVVDVADGTQLHVGEVLLLDSEKMLVVAITGNNATVIRAYDGTTLAAHTAPVDVYAYRTLTVERGALGTTASTHSLAATVTKWVPPGPATTLAIAEAITTLEQQASAYGRRVGSDEAERDSSGTEVFAGRGLSDLRRQTKVALGRRFRKRAV
jgi:hypothetical protein